MVKVESFQLDHTKLVAPYVRKCSTMIGENGDKVTKYDLRFTQPTKEAMGTAAIHALEHLLAGFIREELDGVIDLSPMGCRTGFYLIMWGDKETSEIKTGLENALKKVLDAKEVPARSEVECGNYKDLSLFGAKEYAKQVLNKGISLNIYGDK
ncbi:S-ribosylhomocysteine lyase /quorum-sensing autoinducer 2 (AI-2) synthesis protein LuxS [Clostridium sp. USBA 49]|uniref:S-ribosylhomocysteine lyase n=1 Tax=Clostridium sp. USBA 49 TaxID=1881060 RepID=UPI00099B01C9|nr:S-ribosylhomocysteine lyase [Clostridium sp. USBA 49]SKA85802.1 S-ribosylhomocysteine lyase /quorum-sensing autoinducer 2 (AI-2) synthesis protein LuxS [Clostridium sp. USBA 49]